MGWFNQYPYEDNEELNLDYLLAKVAALKHEIIETNAQIDGFNALLVQKVDKATTLYGYGITDAYTKTETDNLLVLKADKANVYNKTEVDNLLLPKVNASDLATVATTGSYTDLINKPTIPAPQVNSDWNANSGVAQILNKPTIPAAQVNSDWNANSGVAQILNKPSLATVATSGSYTDLINKPTIPAAVYMGVIGAGSTILNTLINIAPVGDTLWQTQIADDSPTRGTVSSILMCKHTGSGIYSYIFHFNANGEVRYASTGNPTPASLTWNLIKATDSTKEPKITWTTSGNWRYYKDSSNYYHLFYKSGNVTHNFNGTIGSLKYNTTPTSIAFPITLSNVISAQVTLKCANDMVGGAISNYTSTNISIWEWGAGSGNHTIEILLDILAT